uniref:Uncharacterized protein n=1 Tax=Amphimedon queenslandica TaxID=400682 RepID=A0A1X7TIP0_AMPQE
MLRGKLSAIFIDLHLVRVPLRHKIVALKVEKICKKLFLFVYSIRNGTHKNLRRHFLQNGIKPRVHGNTGRIPCHAVSVEGIKDVVAFLENYAEDYAILLPGMIPRVRDYGKAKLLPSSVSQRMVYRQYADAGREHTLCESSFKRIWRKRKGDNIGVNGSIDEVAGEELEEEICKKLFLFVYSIRNGTYKNLRRHFLQNGIKPRVHGNTGRIPCHAVSVEGIKDVVAFLENYAEDYTIVLPGMIPGVRDYGKAKLLPSSVSRHKVYRQEPGAEIYGEIDAFPYARTAEGGGAYRESNRTDGHLYFSDMAHPPLLLPKAMNILTEVM